MSTPFFQPVSPDPAPDPVTPADGPGDQAGWDSVTPDEAEPAPYSISAPQDIAGITGALNAAVSLSGGQEGTDTGAGMPNHDSPRQQEANAILDSSQGAQSSNVFSGFPDYQNTDVRPGANLETPIQGMGDYPGTSQPGLPQFMAGLGAGVAGVPPEGGSMAGSEDMDYPGTTQDGLTKYGTS